MVVNVRGPRRVRKQMGRYRCFLNSREVTNRTFYADGRRGVVRMYLLSYDGEPYVDSATGDVAWEERRGRVALRRRRDRA